MIDSHAHLDSPRYDEDREAMLRRAWGAGVREILSIGIGEGPDTMQRALEISREYAGQPDVPKIWASAGVHPHEASLADEAAMAKLDALLQEPEVLACGEIGLDYYYDHSPRDVQKQVFARQMEIAAARRRPIIIHCRPSDNSSNAWDDVLEMLQSHWSRTGLRGILHCFTGEMRHAQAALDLGFLISFAGNITFPKAQAIRDAALVVEAVGQPVTAVLHEALGQLRGLGVKGGLPGQDRLGIGGHAPRDGHREAVLGRVDAHVDICHLPGIRWIDVIRAGRGRAHQVAGRPQHHIVAGT